MAGVDGWDTSHMVDATLDDLAAWAEIARVTGEFGLPRTHEWCPVGQMFRVIHHACDVAVNTDRITAIGPPPTYYTLYEHPMEDTPFALFTEVIDACPDDWLTYEYIQTALDAARASTPT